MKTFIHGTTLEALESIMTNGFIDKNINYNDKTIWNCSNSDYTYFRELDEDKDSIYLCISNAQIAAAMKGSKNTKLAIITLEMSDELAEEIVEMDNSCENMEDCFQIENTDIQKFIESGDIKIKADIYTDAYMPSLRAFYLKNILDNDYLSIADPELYSSVCILQDNLQNSFIEEIYEFGSIYETKTNFMGIEYEPFKEIEESEIEDFER